MQNTIINIVYIFLECCSSWICIYIVQYFIKLKVAMTTLLISIVNARVPEGYSKLLERV